MNKDYASPVKCCGGKYLLCYFIGNGEGQEKIHFALSCDGYNFKPLNNDEPVIIQKTGKKCVRDPFVLRGKKGEFYIIGTDMRAEEGWLSNHALVSWRSDDLINWTDETNIDMRLISGFENTTRAWAPEVIFDEKEGKFMIYWANSVGETEPDMYYAYTEDFKTITTPKLLYHRDEEGTIDADIVKSTVNGKYYMYFKCFEKIAYVTSDELTGPYSTEPVVVSLAPKGCEGSFMYNIHGTDMWVMMMDEYGNDRYFAQQTTDFESFKELEPGSYNYGPSPRHANIISITDEEYERLVDAFGI